MERLIKFEIFRKIQILRFDDPKSMNEFNLTRLS